MELIAATVTKIGAPTDKLNPDLSQNADIRTTHSLLEIYVEFKLLHPSI